MALADFIPRRAANTIEAVPAAEPPRPAGGAGDRSASTAASSPGEPSAAAPDAAPARKPPPARGEPEAIARSYYVEDAGDRRTYYQDYQRKNVAFTATEARVSSSHEDLRTVRDMVEVARARGWTNVELRGSETFRREAWIEAAAAGLDARGHKATEPDRQEAERRRGERGLAAPTNGIAPAAPSASPSASPRSSTRAAAPAGSAGVGPDGSASAAPTVVVPTAADHRRTLRAAEAELSPDGKLILGALSEKIDRQMNRYNADAKVELKAFVATELRTKEREQGPVALSAEQRGRARAPEPARDAARAAPSTVPTPSPEPEQPRLSRAR